MTENKMHLIPQAIIDCASDLATTRNENTRINYIVRLETIRDYCDQVLRSNEVASTFSRNKPKGKFSTRIERNKV